MTVEKLRPSEIAALKPMEVLDNEKIEGRFINVVNKMTKTEIGAQIYAREQQWFKTIISETPALAECTPTSIFSAFMDVATLGLSVAKGSSPLAYLIPYNIKIKGTQGQPDRWEKRVSLEVSPYGELAMRVNFKQIKYADNPIIVYRDDTFVDEMNHGKRSISYKKNMESKDRTIKCGFIRFVKMDGSEDYFVMDMERVERLKEYSERKNKGQGANKLYTSNKGQIDEGFFAAKIIKHAFKSLPKSPYMQLLGNTILQSEKEENLDELKDLTTLSDEPGAEAPPPVEDQGDAVEVKDEQPEGDNHESF